MCFHSSPLVPRGPLFADTVKTFVALQPNSPRSSKRDLIRRPWRNRSRTCSPRGSIPGACSFEETSTGSVVGGAVLETW